MLTDKEVLDIKKSGMSKFAKEKSIAFAEWLSGLGYQQYDGADRWISFQESGNRVFTTKQLYEKFEKEC